MTSQETPMASNDTRKLETLDIASTARIDRRQTVLAQIEAALHRPVRNRRRHRHR